MPVLASRVPWLTSQKLAPFEGSAQRFAEMQPSRVMGPEPYLESGTDLVPMSTATPPPLPRKGDSPWGYIAIAVVGLTIGVWLSRDQG